MADRAPVREDFLDYPTAWQIQREMGDQLEHIDIRCSAVEKPGATGPDRMAGPAFLCDCGAVEGEWKVRVAQQQRARERPPNGTEKPRPIGADLGPSADTGDPVSTVAESSKADR